MSDLIVKFQKLHDDVQLPVQGTPGSAGYDLFAYDNTLINPGERKLISTGLIMEVYNKTDDKKNLYYDFMGEIRSRSSLALKGIDVGAGVIDSDYRGEIKVLLCNNNTSTNGALSSPFVIKKGDRIAQLIFTTISHPKIKVVKKTKSVSTTDRNTGGFGSTGV